MNTASHTSKARLRFSDGQWLPVPMHPAQIKAELSPPGPDLVKQVRAGFVLKGTTLGRWCREQHIPPQHARLALLGGWNGTKGSALRERLITVAGLHSSRKVAA